MPAVEEMEMPDVAHSTEAELVFAAVPFPFYNGLINRLPAIRWQYD